MQEKIMQKICILFKISLNDYFKYFVLSRLKIPELHAHNHKTCIFSAYTIYHEIVARDSFLGFFTHLLVMSRFRQTGKQWRPRSDCSSRSPHCLLGPN